MVECKSTLRMRYKFYVASVLTVCFLTLFIVFLVLYLNIRDAPLTERVYDTDVINRQAVEWVSPVGSKLSGREKFAEHVNLGLLSKQARENFVVSRYCRFPGTKPKITIVTRTFKRPLQLERNIRSVQQMFDVNYEHVILHDQVGSGLEVSEAALFAFREEFRGDYICHLDDDNYLSNFAFVTEMLNVLRLTGNVKAVVYKVWDELSQVTKPLVWKSFPREGEITTSNVLVRRDVYMDRSNLGAIVQAENGDYKFLHNVFTSAGAHEVAWVDHVYFCVCVVQPDEKVQAYPGWPEYVTFRLIGGLGNQMFQAAVGYAISRNTGRKLLVDKRQKRVDERNTYYEQGQTLSWLTHSSKLEEMTWNEYVEPHFHYAKIPDKAIYGNLRIRGYFQSVKYFSTYRAELIELFTAPHHGISLPDFALPTISVHLRRGDYVNNSFHTSQTQSYYQRALHHVMEETGHKQFQLVVFSDDIPWCQEQFPGWFPAQELYFVPVGAFRDEQELYLMSTCNHHILANSSFSWWGAFLDTNPEAKVVAPAKWFNDPDMNWQDIYVEGWYVC